MGCRGWSLSQRACRACARRGSAGQQTGEACECRTCLQQQLQWCPSVCRNSHGQRRGTVAQQQQRINAAPHLLDDSGQGPLGAGGHTQLVINDVAPLGVRHSHPGLRRLQIAVAWWCGEEERAARPPWLRLLPAVSSPQQQALKGSGRGPAAVLLPTWCCRPVCSRRTRMCRGVVCVLCVSVNYTPGLMWAEASSALTARRGDPLGSDHQRVAACLSSRAGCHSRDCCVWQAR
jgi:hypothetical protein